MKAKKPSKPYKEFPLFPHAGGVWAKKIRGEFHYFGPWSDPNGALDKYLKERDFLYAGKPPPLPDGVTLLELADRYMASKLAAVERGELNRQHYRDCKRDTQLASDTLGPRRLASTLTMEDFRVLRAKISDGRNATTITNTVNRIRAMFTWAHRKAKIIDSLPDYGDEFSPPPLRIRRKALREGGPRDMAPEAIHAMLDAAKEASFNQLLNLRAMILLGINCGMGNTDCAALTFADIDLKAGFIDNHRPKTEEHRRAALWTETIKAIQDAIERRKKLIKKRGPLPADLKDIVFLTKHRRPYVSYDETGESKSDAVGQEFLTLARSLGIKHSFYDLRRTFCTIADESLDGAAVKLVMGHRPHKSDMTSVYRQRLPDERLQAVAQRVRTWLFGQSVTTPTMAEKTPDRPQEPPAPKHAKPRRATLAHKRRSSQKSA